MNAQLDSGDLSGLASFVDALDGASATYGFHIDMDGVEVCNIDGATVGHLVWNSDADTYVIAVQP